ncbi:hypothetical protein C4J81_13070 [Deltaproteobacteria bacterium Smac51]|nr:hypothetical protein C4J81_13070 [Deltaproteobacteria bacterium Smac51]
MTALTPDFESMANAAIPLTELLETYSQCLNMSREYVAVNADIPSGEEVDVDMLQDFLSARADLFAVAEKSFNALSDCQSTDSTEEAIRLELTNKVVTLLEEMTEVENQLATFLGDRLEKMRDTIKKMQRAQPVFKRYSHLGGDKMAPSRITRHG